MDQHPADGGSQLILDNRKIILGFAVLILICGTFFVIGFMEGKRQGPDRAADKVAEHSLAVVKTNPQLPAAKADAAPSIAPGDKGVREKLDWYNSVNKRTDEGVKGLESIGSAKATASGSSAAAIRPTTPPAGQESISAGARPKPPNNVPAAKITYSVQVGAFRYRTEAETKGEQLRVKKYPYVIESSGDTNQLFLLKVGKYESRADAVAMQNRLKKDGFSTFIKTNK